MSTYSIRGLIMSSIIGTLYLISMATDDFHGALGLNAPPIRRPDLYKKALESGKTPPEQELIEFFKRNRFSV